MVASVRLLLLQYRYTRKYYKQGLGKAVMMMFGTFTPGSDATDMHYTEEHVLDLI